MNKEYFNKLVSFFKLLTKQLVNENSTLKKDNKSLQEQLDSRDKKISDLKSDLSEKKKEVTTL